MRVMWERTWAMSASDPKQTSIQKAHSGGCGELTEQESAKSRANTGFPGRPLSVHASVCRPVCRSRNEDTGAMRNAQAHQEVDLDRLSWHDGAPEVP
jgi:hypothetical protein